MKAAVIFKKGEMPQYVLDFPEPTASGEDIVMNVTAAAVKHLDRSKASGKHYSTKDDFSDAKVIGGDGVGLLADGTRVFALGNTGMLAEKALISKNKMVKYLMDWMMPLQQLFLMQLPVLQWHYATEQL